MRSYSIIILMFLACNNKINTTSEPPSSIERSSSININTIKPIDSVNIDFQFRGNCYAYSSNKNAEAHNGEAHSSNLPFKVDKTFPNKGFYLFINTKEKCIIDSMFLGYKLYLVNTTNDLVTLNACDSRLDIVAEALDRKNKWLPITYLPSSFCGNSYHTVKLDEEEYWSFNIPVFKGSFKTKMRYKLIVDKEYNIYSNEIITYLNLGQFDKENKAGHNPNNIMDPYTD